MKISPQTISLSGRRKKKLQQQVDKYLADLKKDRSNYKLHIDLGDSYALLEDSQHSIKSYYAAIELLRQSANIAKYRNLIAELYGKIINVVPDEQRAYLELSEEYVATGQKEKAFRFLLASAKKAYESGNYDFALQCYNQVISKGRTNPHIVERSTELYLKLGRKEEAMQNYVSIGDMYAQEEKNIEALEYYKKANALNKDEPELILKIARMYNAMEWTENAAAELVRLGEYYEKRQNHNEALKYYRNATRLDPENERAQQGHDRVTKLFTIDVPPKDISVSRQEQTQDILEELKKIEEAEGPTAMQEEQPSSEESFLSTLESTPAEPPSLMESMLDLQNGGLESLTIDEGVVSSEFQEAETATEHQQVIEYELARQEETIQESLQLGESEPVTVKTDIQFLSEDTLAEFAETTPVAQTVPVAEPVAESASMAETVLVAESASMAETVPVAESVPAPAPASAPAVSFPLGLDLQALVEEAVAKPEEPFTAFTEEPARQETTLNHGQAAGVSLLQQKVKELEQQLERTEEEKHFLQEQFAAQIGRLKVQEQSLQKEISKVYHEKEEVERRLQQILATYQTSREDTGRFDETRYEALVSKIQSKKVQLQQQLTRLLKKREENGRFLSEELNALGATKQRLQMNLEYLQNLKTRLEEKIQIELHQAHHEIEILKETSQTLEVKLLEQEQAERALQQQFEAVLKEKDALQEMQENSTETIDALTSRNADLERQMQHLAKTKELVEKALKKKFYAVQQSYQQRQAQYQVALQTKELQLTDNAQKLSEFTEKYVKLEKTLADIRKERDQLGTLLVQETATRESLEEKLVGIESQVDSLEIQGTELLNQLGQELDRHFALEQSTSDEFQESLDELERILHLQEEEIRSLEAL